MTRLKFRRDTHSRSPGWLGRACALALASSLAGCGSLEGNIAAGVVGATVLGAQSPNNEIEQIYYLGVFDPQEQLPLEVYRVRVHGQASFISLTRFASGWVPAPLIDSLGTTAGFFNESDSVTIKGGDQSLEGLKTGRRLMLFGPEGFREAPRDHRLVIVMGSNPEGFFQAIDQSLGVVSKVRAEQRNAVLERMLFEAQAQIGSERRALTNLVSDTRAELGPGEP